MVGNHPVMLASSILSCKNKQNYNFLYLYLFWILYIYFLCWEFISLPKVLYLSRPTTPSSKYKMSIWGSTLTPFVNLALKWEHQSERNSVWALSFFLHKQDPRSKRNLQVQFACTYEEKLICISISWTSRPFLHLIIEGSQPELKHCIYSTELKRDILALSVKGLITHYTLRYGVVMLIYIIPCS